MADEYTLDNFPYDMVHVSFARYSCDWTYCPSKRKQLKTRIIVVSGRKTHKFGFYELIPTSNNQEKLTNTSSTKESISLLNKSPNDRRVNQKKMTNHITFKIKSFIKDYKKENATLDGMNFQEGYAHSFITKDNKYILAYKHGFRSCYNVYDIINDKWLLNRNCNDIKPCRWIDPSRRFKYSWNDSIRMTMVNDEIIVLSCVHYFQLYSISNNISKPVIIGQCLIDDGCKFNYHGLCCFDFKYVHANVNGNVNTTTAQNGIITEEKNDDIIDDIVGDIFDSNVMNATDKSTLTTTATRVKDNSFGIVIGCSDERIRITHFKLIIFGGSRIKHFSKSFYQYDVNVSLAATSTNSNSLVLMTMLDKNCISHQGIRQVKLSNEFFNNEGSYSYHNFYNPIDQCMCKSDGKDKDIEYFKHFGCECMTNSNDEPVLLLIGGDCGNLQGYDPMYSMLLVNLNSYEVKHIKNVCFVFFIIYFLWFILL